MAFKTNNMKSNFSKSFYLQKTFICILIITSIIPSVSMAYDMTDLVKDLTEFAAEQPGYNNPSSNESYSNNQLQGGGDCAANDRALETEFIRKDNAIPGNDNVARLALIHNVSLRMRDIWLPCNKEKARNYDKTAADTLSTCLGIATDPALCTR